MNELICYDEIFTVTRGILNNCGLSFYGYSLEEMNLMCLTHFGSYYLAPIVTYLINDKTISDDNLTILGRLIQREFSQKWIKYDSLLNENYSPLANYGNVETEEYKSNVAISDDLITNINNDIFAFNSDESVGDTKTKTQSNSNRANEINSTRTKSIQGYTGNNLPSEMLLAEIKFRSKGIIDYVLHDLKEFATLPIAKY